MSESTPTNRRTRAAAAAAEPVVVGAEPAATVAAAAARVFKVENYGTEGAYSYYPGETFSETELREARGVDDAALARLEGRNILLDTATLTEPLALEGFDPTASLAEATSAEGVAEA